MYFTPVILTRVKMVCVCVCMGEERKTSARIERLLSMVTCIGFLNACVHGSTTTTHPQIIYQQFEGFSGHHVAFVYVICFHVVCYIKTSLP